MNICTSFSYSHFLCFVTVVTQLSRWSIYMALACGNRDFGEKKLELYYFRSVFFCQGLPYSIFLLSRSPSVSAYHHPATHGAVWLFDCDMEKLFCSLASKLCFLKNKALCTTGSNEFLTNLKSFFKNIWVLFLIWKHTWKGAKYKMVTWLIRNGWSNQ